MITYRVERIEVWDAHAHMGRREQVAIHQIPRIMSFTPDEMVARMDESGVDVSLWLSSLPAFLRRALSAEAHQSEVS